MKIAAVETWRADVPLTRPYTIAFKTTSAVSMMGVKIVAADGAFGLGAASPEPAVTRETFASCEAALGLGCLDWLVGRDLFTLQALCRELETRMPRTPAARAAIDMALHDLFAKMLGRPLVELLGRAHDVLPTSITIGIKDVHATLAEADEYVARGFRVLKVKIGTSLEEDIERLRKLRERFGDSIAIRVDANQGYDGAQVQRFFASTATLAIEFVEQPLRPADDERLRALPEAMRDRIAADESVHVDVDALRLVRPPRACGIFNIKLMKSGGIRAALRIATIAECSGVALMWGCMDESVIGISAALHTALACPSTRFLDLDGSLDLARDFARGGFSLENGRMRTTDRPGLGVELA